MGSDNQGTPQPSSGSLGQGNTPIAPPPGNPPRDLAGSELGPLPWEIDEAEASLDRLYNQVEKRAVDAIGWYNRGKRRWAFRSKSMRFLAIILTTLGGLVPIIQGLDFVKHYKGELSQIGYVVLALAAACLALDRFFGFSTAWIRFISTSLALQNSLQDFQLDWQLTLSRLAGGQLTQERVTELVGKLKDFNAVVYAEIQKETQAWITEFQTNLGELEKLTKAQLEAAKPGIIDITLTNLDKMDDQEATIYLDGVQSQRVKSKICQFANVFPGQRCINVQARNKKAPINFSRVVVVTPGSTVTVEIVLPV